MVQLQDSISKCLHHHTLFSMLSNEIFEAHHVWILSCSGPRVGVWLTVRLVFPTFQLFFLVFFITLHMGLRLPHPLIVGILWCMCTHPINIMGIHLLHYAHGNECTRTHDAIHNTFAAIMRDVSFHVGQKQLHLLFSTTFNFSYWW
jgi:hypothetical protein